MEIASSTSSNEQQQLYIGQYFVTWDTAIEYVQKWCNIQGFQTRFNHSERNAEGKYRKLTIICQHDGKFRKPLTELQTNKEKSKKSINQFRWVLVNYENEVMMSEEMLKDIEFLTKHVHLSTTQQRIYLEEKYPEQKIRSDILCSEIQKYRPSAKDLSNDTSKLYEYLIKLKDNDTRWQIFVDFDETKVLRRLFWMICQALVDDETADAHIWILECTLLATGGKRQNENINGGLIPLVFMTDSDPAVDAACIRVYKGCYAMHCIYHINQNLHKNLFGPLGENYSQFLNEFYNARNSLSQERFERLFHELVEKYKQISNYLNNLYKSKTYWAFCYTSTIFTAATQITSRVEGLNAVLKKELINSNTSLVQLNKTITRRHQEEKRQKEYAFWKSVIPCVIVSQTANFLFPAVETIIKNYLTDPLYNLQVNQSVYYRCEQFDLNQFNIFEQV
ncbi:unnamed protein product [Rhizophagus irregularis]|nr:unnamed protein product [Rhizophagus irregularis]